MEKSLGSSLQITSQSEIPTHFTTQIRTSKIQIESMSHQQQSSHAAGAQRVNGSERAWTNNEVCWQLTPAITPCQTVLCRLCMRRLRQKPMVSPLHLPCCVRWQNHHAATPAATRRTAAAQLCLALRALQPVALRLQLARRVV